MKKREERLASVLLVLIYMAAGMAGGWIIGSKLGDMFPGLGSPVGIVLAIVASLVLIYAASVLQVIIHEGGHLVFGLLSGYRFLSFRVFSLMWAKKDGKINFTRYSLAGTGGQCLLGPPPYDEGRYPVVLYNLGGVIANTITSVIAFLLMLWLKNAAAAVVFFGMLAIAGLALALTNGLPMKNIGGVNNDGRNALDAVRSIPARRSLWIQLQVTAEISEGKDLTQLPDEWFVLPDDELMKENSLVASIGVLAANRLMSAMRFEEADSLMEKLTEGGYAIVGVYQVMLTNDRIFIELAGENRREVLDRLNTEQFRKQAAVMKTNISILRTQAAWALLQDKDEEKFRKLKQRFEREAARYPYPTEAEGERKLLAIAAAK